MKTNIRKFPAVLLLAVLCLTVFPISAMAAGVAEVKIPVSVELSGEKPSPDETYTIILQGEDEAPMPEENILTVTGAGNFLQWNMLFLAYTLTAFPSSLESWKTDIMTIPFIM